MCRNSTIFLVKTESKAALLMITCILFSGVTCDSTVSSATYGRVLSIVLSSVALSGTLPLSIGNFEAMTAMSFYRTKISGTIPSTIGLAESLQVLHLIDNSFNGSIPASLGQLLSLTDLNLNSNHLVGSIPSALVALTKLSILEMGGNSFTGSIPSAVGNLASLTQLVLYDCFLSGTIPSTMSALKSLAYLDLENNYLTMGTSSSVPNSTFSATTLSGTLTLDRNCLAFSTKSPLRSVTATHCSPTSKYQVSNDLTLYCYRRLYKIDDSIS